MKKLLKTLIVIMFLLVSASSTLAMSYDEAMNSNRPFALYIYMQGCPACRQFDSVFEEAESKHSSKFNFVREEYSTGTMPRLCQSWKVNSFPFLAFVNPKNNSAKRIPYKCMWDQSCLNGSFYKFP